MQSLIKRKFFLILKRFFGLFALPRRSPIGAKAGVLIVVLAIGVAVLLVPSLAGATDVLGGASMPSMMENVGSGIAQMLTKVMLGLGEFCIKMSFFFLRFFIAIASYNGYIDSPVVKLGWLMVRDVVNMFFVVILLVIAIGTILGIEQYQWNKTLIKLILAAVFVNFSNLICQIFIDAAHVFTITFASAISATAGGNLINMFRFDDIYAIVTGKKDIGMGGEGFDLTARVLVGSIVAFLFALLAMLIMAAYAIMMLLRMVVLWVLIILSPIAFLFIALPQTQNRYAEWWKEFSNYVVLAPTIAFFMWLAFATAGTGTLGSDIGITDNMGADIDAIGALTVSAVTTWANMANFLVALVLLFVGLQEVQKLNVAGGSFASKAKDFFGKVATIATGYAAGRWLAGAAGRGAKMAGKGVLWHMPMGGEFWSEHAKKTWARTKDAWYTGAGGKGELHEADYLGRAMRGAFGWNVGRLAARTARRKKHLKAAEGTAEAAEALLQKMQSTGQWGNRSRTRRGELEAYEKRSKERDAEGIAESKLRTLAGPRWKDGQAYVNPETGEVSTLADEAARFALRRERFEEEEKGMIGEKRKGIIDRSEEDRKRAAEESEEVRKGRKSDELRSAEDEEEGIKKTLQEAQAKVKAEVDIRLKADDEVKKAQAVLDTASNDIRMAEQRVTESERARAVMAELTPEEKARHEQAKEELTGKLGKYAGQPIDALLEELYKSHGWDRGQDEANREQVRAYVDASRAEQLPEAQSERQKAKNKAEDALNTVSDTATTITEKVEAEMAAQPDGVNLANLRKDYEGAQKKTSDERVAWEKVAEAAAKPSLGVDTEAVATQRQRDNDTRDALVKIQNDLFKGTLIGADGGPVLGKDGKPVKRADSNIAIAYLQAKQRAATAGAGVEAAETEAQRMMLGLESFQSLFSAEVASKMGAEASKMFIDGIKEKKMGELFKKGAEKLKEALEEGGASLEKLQLKDVGARMAQAQKISEYHKDITAANKAEAADHAESIFTVERYGFKTPSSAFKDWVKKQTERLQGVEREQSVKNAMGTLGQFFKLQRQGKEISTDQKAQMMAHLKHLTSHGWMDDLLDGIGKKSRNKASFTGEEREEAEALEDVFLTQLRWNKDDNRSGADRTAQVQKLVGMGGDTKQMQSEELVLWNMENTGRRYSDANKYVAKIAQDNADAILDEKTTRDAKAEIAIKAGAITADQLAKAKAEPTNFKANAAVDAGINQLVAYTKRFVEPVAELADGAEKAADAFMKSMDRFQDAFEMLADFKNLAIETGHADDGGHTYYDINEGKVRGNLGHKGKEFVMGEVRKLGLDQRLSRLKTHTLGQMSEDYGTIDYTASEECDNAIREIFAGLSNQREFAKVDGRNKDNIAGMAAGEAIRQDEGGKTLIGDDDSRYYRGTFKHIRDPKDRKKAVEDQIRGNYAAFLRNNPAALFGSLAERSGLSFDDGMEGRINVNVCGRKMGNVGDLVNWVNDDPRYHFNPERIKNSLARTKKGKEKGEGE